MLTAAAHGKLKRQIDLWEDEITSCILGEMQHLPVQDVWEIFRKLAAYGKIPKDLSHIAHPDEFKFEFWPKWETGSGYVEPDLVVHFYKDRQTILRFIIEVKWNAQLSPPCELVRQWRYRLPDDTATWLHLYLVKKSAQGITEIKDSIRYFERECPDECKACEDKALKKGLSNGRKFHVSDWETSLGCIGWRHVIASASEVSYMKQAWHEGIAAFFVKQGIVPFVGFGWLEDKEYNISMTSVHDEVLFHREPWFGFLEDMVIKNDESDKHFFQ